MFGTLCYLLIAGPVSASPAVQRIDDYLAGLETLTSEFTQYSFNAERTRMTESHGRFYLQRPGRFRWVYEDPTQQVIIADGSRVYLHDLDLDQVTHQAQDKALRGTPALLLADDAPIERHFEVRTLDSSDGRDWIGLTPKAADSDILRIELGFRDQALESLIMEDGFGQTTRLDFSKIERNPKLDPKLFKIDQSAVDEFLSFD